jgi:energy-coupling factor transport system permease protein
MGQYFPVKSFVHSMDPRAKMVSLAAVIAAVFSSHDPASLAVCAAAFIGAAALARLPVSVVLRSCRPILFLAALTFVLNACTPLWGDWEPTVGGGSFAAALMTGGVAAARLTLLMLFAVLLPLTTSPLSLADGFEAAFSPFARLGFPAHECAMMITVALRFIPLLTDETDRITKAQLSRGAPLDQGNFVRRMLSFFPVLIPLFVIIFRRADELAAAMEARGYSGGKGRTRLHPLAWKKSDARATIFVLAAVAAFLFWK